MKAKIVINTWVDTRTEEEQHMAFFVKGYAETSEVWSGELEIIPKGVYLLKMSVIAEGEPHPIVEVPFSIGIGHWLWVPPDPIETKEGDLLDAEELASGRNLSDNPALPRLIRDSRETALPRMAIESEARKPRFRLPFRHNRRYGSPHNSDHSRR